MIINRIWAMPNKNTFLIKPIKELLGRYVVSGNKWVDPFAGNNSPAGITNDLNPQTTAQFHMRADEFCRSLQSTYDGVLFDPPYSLRQVKECYNNIGAQLKYEETINGQFGDVKDIMSGKINRGGYAISFGWNSMGFGKQRGFSIVEILLVPHGGPHNDTIVTVEHKE